MSDSKVTKKKALLLMAFIWIIITFSIVKTTYAKYVTSMDGSTNVMISYWNIIIKDGNNEDDEGISILANQDISQSISIVLPGNDYIDKNVLVPGATGYFDLNINTKEVGMPCRMTLTANINENSTLDYDFIIYGYSLGNDYDTIYDAEYVNDSNNEENNTNELDLDDENNNTSNDEDIIEQYSTATSFYIDIDKDTEETKLRVYTKWLDSGTDDIDDTNLGISGGTAILDVNLNFDQIIQPKPETQNENI